MRISPKQLLHGLFYSTPVLLLALTACGGGGGGGGSSGVAAALTATATPTAQILAVSSPMASFSPLTASGGTPPYTYFYPGSLPPGVTMVPSTGVVSGTPTTAASSVAMTFSVRDVNNSIALTTSTVNFAVFGAWPGTRELGVATTRGWSSATDASGNIYVAGSTTGGLDGNTLTGSSDFYLTKYDASGSKVYTKQLGATGATTIGYAAATDASGNVYVAGSTAGTPGATGLSGTQTGSTDMFLARYDSSGNPASSNPIIQLGVTGADTLGNAVATDASGNVYVAGSTTGNLGTNTVTGVTDMFLTKYDASGSIVYTKQLGDSGANTYGQSVATDASGNIYVAGYTDGDLINHTGTSTGATDFFLTKYNASGIIVYTRQLGVSGGAANTQALSVATDASGNVYVAGYTDAGLDGNPQMGTDDFFLTKYNASGTKIYTKQVGGVSGTRTYGLSVATDAYGNVYVSGNTTADLNLSTALPASTSDSFLTKYNASGTKVYTRQLGVTGQSTSGNGVATYANGNVFVAGDTGANLDGGTLVGTQNFFLTKYDANGTKQ
jgi:hypothetical protein